MKKKIQSVRTLLLLAIFMGLFACKDDDNPIDKTAPEITLKAGEGYVWSDTLMSKGATVKIGINGKGANNKRLFSLVIQQDGTTISNLENIQKNKVDAELDVKLPDTKGSTTIIVTVKDVVGASTQKKFLIETAEFATNAIAKAWQVESTYENDYKQPREFYQNFRLSLDKDVHNQPTAYRVTPVEQLYKPNYLSANTGAYVLDNLLQPSKITFNGEGEPSIVNILEFSDNKLVLEWQVPAKLKKTEPVIKLILIPAN